VLTTEEFVGEVKVIWRLKIERRTKWWTTTTRKRGKVGKEIKAVIVNYRILVIVASDVAPAGLINPAWIRLE
jgi:hypothetical protein